MECMGFPNAADPIRGVQRLLVWPAFCAMAVLIYVLLSYDFGRKKIKGVQVEKG